jgi:hypothetical protein
MRKAVVFLLVTSAVPGAAHADWRYCFGLDRPGQTVYLSEAFASEQPAETLDDAYAGDLARQVGSAFVVNCPRAADEAELRDDRLRAAEYNRENGNAVVETRWQPDSRVAGLP